MDSGLGGAEDGLELVDAVDHFVAEADAGDGGVFADGAGEGGHGVGDVEHPGGGADALHVSGDGEEGGDGAEAAAPAAGADGVGDGLAHAVGVGDFHIEAPGVEPAGGDGDHDVAGAVEGGGAVVDDFYGEVGTGLGAEQLGDEAVGFGGLVVDIVEHEGGAGEGGVDDEIADDPGPPVEAAAADEDDLWC